MRTYRTTDCRITFLKLVPHKNHSQTHYHTKYVDSRICSRAWVKELRGRVWKFVGVII